MQDCFFLLSRAHSSNQFADEAKTALMLNRLAVRERFRTCKPLFAEWNASGLPYAVIKGAALSQSAYGNPAARCSSDIDLLTSLNIFNILQTTILKNGFIQGRIESEKLVSIPRQEKIAHMALTHQAAPFLKKTTSRFCPIVNLDVNLDILWGEKSSKASEKTDMDAFLAHCQDAELDGTVYR